MTLQEIKTLIQQDRCAEAIVECDSLLFNAPEESKNDILRVRAQAFSMSGEYNGALRDYDTVINSGSADQRDYYLAGFAALNLEDFTTAAHVFREVIRLGNDQGDQWFESASYFYISYAEMELGNYDEADKNLRVATRLSPEISMPIPGVGVSNSDQLRRELERRF